MNILPLEQLIKIANAAIQNVIDAIKKNGDMKVLVAAKLSEHGYRANLLDTGGGVICIQVHAEESTASLIIGNDCAWGADIYDGDDHVRSVNYINIKDDWTAEQIADELIRTDVGAVLGREKEDWIPKEFSHIDPDDWFALMKHAQEHPGKWRSLLRTEWTNGTDEGWSRRIRNSIGPSGLDKVRRPADL